MKFWIFMGTVALAITVFFTGHIYAANGDLIVNGNLGVGTPTPAAKAEVNGNLIVDGNVGVGTASPGQKLSVNGIIQSTTGGIMFPDGSVQNTAKRLVCDILVTVATTAVSCPGLDGNGHGGYELEATIYNSTGGGIIPRIYFNSDTINTHYRLAYAYFGPGIPPAGGGTTDCIFFPNGNINANTRGTVVGQITISSEGYTAFQFQTMTSDGYGSVGGVHKIATVSNLTRLDIVSSSIGANSRFRLWKKIY